MTNLIVHLKQHHKKQHENFRKTTKAKKQTLSKTFAKRDKLPRDGKRATAAKFLCAPFTSVESERLFSTVSIITEEHRSRLTAQHAEMLIFLKKNLHIMLGLQKVEMEE